MVTVLALIALTAMVAAKALRPFADNTGAASVASLGRSNEQRVGGLMACSTIIIEGAPGTDEAFTLVEFDAVQLYKAIQSKRPDRTSVLQARLTVNGHRRSMKHLSRTTDVLDEGNGCGTLGPFC
jgi:hypothetical protein